MSEMENEKSGIFEHGAGWSLSIYEGGIIKGSDGSDVEFKEGITLRVGNIKVKLSASQLLEIIKSCQKEEVKEKLNERLAEEALRLKELQL